jgi:hypothetical protein
MRMTPPRLAPIIHLLRVASYVGSSGSGRTAVDLDSSQAAGTSLGSVARQKTLDTAVIALELRGLIVSPRSDRNADHDSPPVSSTTRRRFLQYTLGGSGTLIMGGTFVGVDDAEASVSLPEPGEILDFAGVITLVETPYASNLVLEVTADNRVRFELPRLDKGQDIATAFAMLVADELDADYASTSVNR